MDNIENQTQNRDKVIIRTSIIGIITNVFLAVFKAAIGVLSNSIAVILDAINNLSDVLSSVITIVGTKLSKKKPDIKHPIGYSSGKVVRVPIDAYGKLDEYDYLDRIFLTLESNKKRILSFQGGKHLSYKQEHK